MPASDTGQETARALLNDFDRLLYSQAETFARQRRTARIDDADFNSAFRDLLAREERRWSSWAIRLFASALILSSGLSLGHSISIWSTTNKSTEAVILLGVGIVAAVIGLALQHLPFKFESK